YARSMSAARRAKPWTHVALRAPQDAVDALVALFVELGAPGAITGQRDLRRSTARESPTATTRVEAYFPPDIARRGLERAVRSGVARRAEGFPRLRPGGLRLAPFAVPDYSQAWRAPFPAIDVGKRLRVCPPWEDVAPDAGSSGRIVLRIHPGQA